MNPIDGVDSLESILATVRTIWHHQDRQLQDQVDLAKSEVTLPGAGVDALTPRLGRPRVSFAGGSDIDALAFETANDESSFTKKPEKVRSFRAVTATPETGVVRNERTPEE